MKTALILKGSNRKLLGQREPAVLGLQPLADVKNGARWPACTLEQEHDFANT